MIRLGDGSDGNGRNADLVADFVREWGLKQAAIDRLFFLPDLTRRAVDQIGSGVLEHLRKDCRVVGCVASLNPVMTGETNRDRLVVRPDRPDGLKDFKRVTRAVLVAAAILVIAAVREWRQETG